MSTAPDPAPDPAAEDALAPDDAAVAPGHVEVTRTAYDTVADDYARLLAGSLAASPVDRAALGLFVEAVHAAGGGPVADVGCGPGRITAYLAAQGLDAHGIDLSPGMVAVARRDHPHLRFDVGSMRALDLPDRGLAGVVAWYSVIHTPPPELPVVFAHLRRVVRDDAPVLLAFQVGDERRRLTQGYGHAIALDAYRLPPDRVVDLLADAGIVVDVRIVREPVGPETTRQAYLLGHAVGVQQAPPAGSGVSPSRHDR